MDFKEFKESFIKFCNDKNIDCSLIYINESNSDTNSRFEFSISGTVNDLKDVVFVIIYFSSIKKFLVWNNTGKPRRTKFTVDSISVWNAVNKALTVTVKDKGYRGGPEEVVRIFDERELLAFISEAF